MAQVIGQNWTGRVCAVTGACGGYGAFLVRALVNAGATVRALDIRRDDHLEFLDSAEQQGKVQFISCNLCADDLSPIREALTGVSIVFHTVAYFGDPQFCVNEFANPGHEEKMKAINVDCVSKIMQVARECGVRGFIHTSSTNTVFSGKEELIDVTESFPYPKPSDCIDLYSVTKAEAERVVIGTNGKDGMFTASVRPNGIYGPSVRCYGIIKLLQMVAPMQGMFFKFQDKHGNEPIADWCHVENLALVQMLVGQQLMEQNPIVCGSIYNASDDVVSTNTEFFRPVLTGAGWTVRPLLPLPASLMQGAAYFLEASCFAVRKLTGNRSFVPPLNCVEAAKSTMSNYQNVAKAKKDLGYVAIPQSELMKGMAEFSKMWAAKHATVAPAPRALWITVCSGMALVMGLSFASVSRMNGTPWQLLRYFLSKLVPSAAAMPLGSVQRKFLVAICLPMLGLHIGDALVAGFLARKKGNLLWFNYALHTLFLGFGKLQHLLPSNSAGPYAAITAASFVASFLAAARVK